jgi:hypothetical protein
MRTPAICNAMEWNDRVVHYQCITWYIVLHDTHLIKHVDVQNNYYKLVNVIHEIKNNFRIKEGTWVSTD